MALTRRDVRAARIISMAAPIVHAASSNPIKARMSGDTSISLSYARGAPDATGDDTKSPRKYDDLRGLEISSGKDPLHLVAVMVRLERACLRHTDVIGLLLAKLSQRDAELLQVQRSDLLVQMLRQDIHFVLVVF